MNVKIPVAVSALIILAASCKGPEERSSKLTGEQLIYHEIRVDSDGNIVPWNYDDPATAYDDILARLWNFWDNMKTDYNGLPYYMNHLAWVEDGYISQPTGGEKVAKIRGIGGDQIAMMLSSWYLYYLYTGNGRVLENMQFMAQYYLAHSMSPSDCKWPDLPFPQNTNIYSGVYDGDMILGPGYLQPDKAASFGYELLNMYRITSRETQKAIYLDAAVKIANTLVRNYHRGSAYRSPWPFKVNAYTGEPGQLRDNEYKGFLGYSDYTTNYAPALELFLGLAKEGAGDVKAYRKVASDLMEWINNFPLKNGRWGPFFEDVPGWSDTQINAVSYAQFLMNHPELDENWKEHARSILDWVYKNLSNDTWKAYGVTAINEQTAYKVPGNSHTARQACAEIQYYSLTGDDTHLADAVRQLNWATYMVDEEGRNRYPQDDIWLTDGYGDYVRHYLRAMAAYPELSPAEPHILSSTDGVDNIGFYNEDGSYDVYYSTASPSGEEVVRLVSRPESVTYEEENQTLEIPEGVDGGEERGYWEWFDCANGGGFAIIYRYNATNINIYGSVNR